jgi:hypothetical protein
MDKHPRRNSNILRVGTTIRQAKDLIANLEILRCAVTEFRDCPGEFDAQGCGGLRGNRVLAFTLEKVHAVQAERFDFDEGLRGSILGYGDVVDVEGVGGTFAVLYG